MCFFRINSIGNGFLRVTRAGVQTGQERLAHEAMVMFILHIKFKKVKGEKLGNYLGKPLVFTLWGFLYV